MDDQESMYGGSQASLVPKSTPGKSTNESVMGGMFAGSRKNMNKKELAAFMKAKLAQTKVSSNAVSGKSASGPGSNNFSKPKQFDSDNEHS